MTGHLEVRRWLELRQPVYSVTLAGDGHYLIAGTEEGVVLFDPIGRCLLTYPPAPEPSNQLSNQSTIQPPQKPILPVQQLAATLDLRRLFVAARQGWLIRLDLERVGEAGGQRQGVGQESRSPAGRGGRETRLPAEGEGFIAQPHLLYQTDSDLYSLALSPAGEIVALGHLSPALTVLQSDGTLLWRRHPSDGTATQGQVWNVALGGQGETLYVGSAGTGSNHLAALDAHTGTRRYWQPADGRVARLTTLASGNLAVALTTASYDYRLVVYRPNLQERLWERGFDAPITALAADPGHDLLAIAVGYEGEIEVLAATSGQVLASRLALRSLVNGLAMIGGDRLAAGTQDGHAAWLYYQSGELRL